MLHLKTAIFSGGLIILEKAPFMWVPSSYAHSAQLTEINADDVLLKDTTY